MTDSRHLEGLARAYRQAPISRWQGTDMSVSDGEAEVRVTVRAEMLHAAAALHGSIYFRLLDDAAFFAANSRIEDVLVLTLSFSVQFFRSVTDGELVARGRIRHVSGRILHCDSDLWDAGGQLCATGRGTFIRSQIPLTSLPGYASGESS